MYITGWTVLLVALGAVPAAVVHERTFAWLWVIGVLALACLDALLAGNPTSVGVRRSTPASVRLTESTTLTLDVANLGRRSLRGAVRDAWQPSVGAERDRHKWRLAAGESTRARTVALPTRRGDLRAGPVTVRLEGPMHLAGRQRLIDAPATLRVLPEFASRKHLPSRLARLREIDGQTAVQLKGAGSEFDSLREYVIGDDVRSIDWRASARRAEVLVKTYRPERDRRVMIVLDTSRLSAARVGDTPRLDASIEGTLLLTALATKAGDRVQVTAFDRVERARALGTSGAAVMPRLADALATVEPALVEPDWPAVARLVQSRMSQRSLVVLLTTLDPSAVDGGLLDTVAAIASKHAVVLASVDDPDLAVLEAGREDLQDYYAAAAAARSALEHHAIGARVRELGAEVLTALPDDLAPALADRYLALKASGRL
ncbi:DUF58 domain-containing protein [Demequina sp.]|uniref:DUF58 domain-containing protein n=1 Tax=Demequina sp. TaxID=2050685 RepID=UPI003A8B6AE9